MELFSEIYNCYYQVVARILEEAKHTPMTQASMTQLAETYGYGESALTILPHLIQGDWALLTPDASSKPTVYHSKLSSTPSYILTALQKSWLKSLLTDDRLSLFLTDEQLQSLTEFLKDTTPLYDPADFLYFDQYTDKDEITPAYRKHFQLILAAIHNRQTLHISYYSVKKRLLEFTYLPCRIEYSAKDGKFRLYALYLKRNGKWRMDILHISRILKIAETGFQIKALVDIDQHIEASICQDPIILEISNERNALERTMLHFSCYQKKVEKVEATGKYLCSIYYDKTRETELLIQVLSFGPVVKVLGPASFLHQIKNRVRRQQECSSY